MLHRRLSILLHYLKHPDRYPYASLGSVTHSLLFPTSAMLARRYVVSRKVTGDYLECECAALNRPLFWPRSIPERWLNQVVGEAFYAWDPHRYEIPETRVRAGDIVIDCGAAEGMFGLQILDRAKRLYLIEPAQIFQQALALTFRNADNVEIVPMALGASPGRMSFAENGIGSALRAEGSLSVMVETIDRLFYERGIQIDYLKADLEGAEMGMLRGAAQTIRQCQPRIAITLYHDGQKADEVVSYLRSLVPHYQYRLKGICAENGQPVMGHFW